MKLSLDLSTKTVVHFDSPSYRNRPDDWDNQVVLDQLGWQYEKFAIVDNETGVFKDEHLEQFRAEVKRFVVNKPNYIWRICLVDEDGNRTPLTSPFSGQRGFDSSLLDFFDIPRPAPEYVPGEEEEEFLLYQDAR